MNNLTIRLNSYGKWQPKTAKKRVWVALDRKVFDNPKIHAVLSDNADAVLCYFWILTNVNNDGELVIRVDVLKRALMHCTGSSSNRFDADKRLQCLCNVGLIEIEDQSNVSLKGVREPLETPEAFINRCKTAPTYKQTDKQSEQLVSTGALSTSAGISLRAEEENELRATYGDSLFLKALGNCKGRELAKPFAYLRQTLENLSADKAQEAKPHEPWKEPPDCLCFDCREYNSPCFKTKQSIGNHQCLMQKM